MVLSHTVHIVHCIVGHTVSYSHESWWQVIFSTFIAHEQYDHWWGLHDVYIYQFSWLCLIYDCVLPLLTSILLCVCVFFVLQGKHNVAVLSSLLIEQHIKMDFAHLPCT